MRVGNGSYGQNVASTQSVGLGHLDNAQMSQISLDHGCSSRTVEKTLKRLLCPIVRIEIVYLDQDISTTP
jgi:hypothetical protein